MPAAKLPKPIEKTFLNLRLAARQQRLLGTDKKNAALRRLADAVYGSLDLLLHANAQDVRRLPRKTPAAFRDRMLLNPPRIAAMAKSLRQVADLSDPNGEVVDSRTLENGLKVKRVRAPLGVLFMIFESRPNVILEAFSLAFKSGNAIALRGGSETRTTSHALYKLMAEALTDEGLGDNPAFFGFNDYDRALVKLLLQRADLIDIAIPRGGDKLIQFVEATATMPIIKNDRGLCHTYVHEDADLEMATKIVNNAKTQRPSVCNALETVLVHRTIAEIFLPALYAATAAKELEWRVDPDSLKILSGRAKVKKARALDWDTEHLDQIMNCRVVSSFDEALTHIAKHGSKHSEAIVTRDENTARRFQNEVDAAAVYWNASTRFTDGFALGLGGELGISTQKLHVRGPVGLRELTSPRWIIDGEGQVRS